MVALVAIIPTLVTAIGGVIAARRASRAAATKTRLEARVKEATARDAAGEALARLAEQMGTVSAGVVDRLRAELESVQHHSAASRVLYEQRITQLEQECAMLQAELDSWRTTGNRGALSVVHRAWSNKTAQ